MKLYRLTLGFVVFAGTMAGSSIPTSLQAEEPLPLSLEDFAGYDSLTWEEHWVQQLDGKGGRICHPAKFRFLPPHEGKMVQPWGLALMDNGEVAVAGVAGDSGPSPQTVLAFSADRGASWSEYFPVRSLSARPQFGDAGGAPGRMSRDLSARPQMLVYLGNGELSFRTSFAENYRYYSRDFGRTWPERVKLPSAPDGKAFNSEGNLLVDRDEKGVAVLLGETGHFMDSSNLGSFRAYVSGGIRWSRDGGRTWDNFSRPQPWTYQAVYEGKTYERGVCEGGLVRAANGWIVAALRTDYAPRFNALRNDNFMGTAVSISKDEGKTWSKLNFVFGPGRMHATLVRLPNNDLVMTVIRRLDLEDGQMASYRRGCDAVISRDNGLTWDVDHMYILDDFASISGGKLWYGVTNGHQFSIGLGDGTILTTYGNYRNAGALIHWKP